MSDCTTSPLEYLFWIFAAFTLLLLCTRLQLKVFQLLEHISEWELYFNTVMLDLYDARYQAINLTAQDNAGVLGYVYVLKSDSGHYKIGKTANPEDRIKTFGVKLPMEVEYLVLIQSHNYHQLEARFHQQFKHKRVNGEWFNLSTADLIYLQLYPGNTIPIKEVV